jgi:hypothetical protein
MPFLFEDPVANVVRPGKLNRDIPNGIMFDLDGAGKFKDWHGQSPAEKNARKDSWDRIKQLDEDDVIGLAGFFPAGGQQSDAVQNLKFCDSDFLGAMLAKRFNQNGKNVDYARKVWVCCCCPL